MRQKFHWIMFSILLVGIMSPLWAGDFYAELASQKYRVRSTFPMERPQPPKLPKDKQLSFNGGDAFRPMEKITTHKQLKAELAKMREQYKPFLQDLAPKLKTPRKRIAMPKMQFRYETAEDRKNFAYTLAGKGEWQTVNIPDYRGPSLPATAWYRLELDLDDSMLASKALYWHFNGVDYYADAYFNGHHVGYHEGMLDSFEFNVRPYARKGKNVLLVRVRNDLCMLGNEGRPRLYGSKICACNSPGWDDPMTGWNCCPRGFGLYQDTYLETRSWPYLNDVFPRPILKDKAVEICVEVNLPDGRLHGRKQLAIDIFGQNFNAKIGKTYRKAISTVGSQVVQRIKLKIPAEQFRLWTPKTPWLYQVQVRLYDASGKKLLDAMKKQFGMRSFAISNTSTPKGRMYLNGKEIRLRGTNTMGYLQRDVVEKNWDQLIDDMLLAKLTNMNFIRTTQRALQNEVYDYADRLGMMMQSDLPLFGYFSHNQFTEAIRQAASMERLLRSHPSAILITYMNEPMRRPHAMSRGEMEKFFDAADIVVRHENPDRAIKHVDGDYMPPSKSLPDNHVYNIWYHGHGVNLGHMHKGGWLSVKKGWMYGCGEFGAEGLDSVDLMTRLYPEAWKKTDKNGNWNPGRIRTKYKTSQNWDKHWFWYETQSKMADWVRMSREHQAWGTKISTETFRRRPRMNTFAIHLFIDAWPNGWMKTIMDVERTPKPAWFVYRDALTPLAVQIRSDRWAFTSGQTYPLELWVCNDTHTSPKAELRYQLELDGKVLQTGHAAATIPTVTQGSAFQGFLPITAPKTDKRTKFTVRVGLFDKTTGKQLHEYDFTADLFPKPATKSDRRLYVIGAPKNSYAASIAKELNVKPVTSGAFAANDTILVDRYADYSKQRAKIDAAVKAGARCMILEQPSSVRQMKIGNTNVKIYGNRTQRWIVFRNIKHPWMAGTHFNDFKFWYEKSFDRPAQQCYRRFSAKGFTPVLTQSGLPVIGEKQDGKGRWIIAQMCFRGRVQGNPQAEILLRKMLLE